MAGGESGEAKAQGPKGGGSSVKVGTGGTGATELPVGIHRPRCPAVSPCR